MIIPAPIDAAVHAALTDAPGRIVVGFSGGLDSTVLLSALAEAVDDRARVIALHVDHGLNPRSAEWRRHCETVSANLGVRFEARRVTVGSHGGTEAAARNARYAAFRGFLVEGDVLWLAHHRDDQAETLLWKLMRGGGVAALAGMPESRRLGAGQLRRPLLDVSRSEIAAWAAAHKLQWIEDDSNADARFDRNFIRRDVLPVLRTRWPDVERRLQHAARRLVDEAALVRAALDRRLEELGVEHERIPTAVARDPHALALLRRWLQRRGIDGVRERVLREIVRQAGGAIDRAPQVQVTASGCSVRRFADHLYLVRARANAFEPLSWTLGQALTIPAGTLLSTRGSGIGLRSDIARVEVRPRRGGERLRPARRNGSHAVKTLLHAEHIPPWLRDAYPLIYVDGRLAAVPGVAVDEMFAQDADGAWQLRVQPNESGEP